MSETNPNNPPPSGYGIPLFQWLVENVLFIKRRINAIAQNMSGGGVTSVFGRTGSVTAESGDYSAFYINVDEKAVANGVATLDSGGLVPLSQLPFSSPLIYQGNWDAATNTPTLSAGTGIHGYMYICSVAGTQNIGEGSYAYEIGDVIVADGDGDWILVGSVGGAYINGTGFVIASGTTLSYLTGTSSQFVKADGTLDSNTYLTSGTFLDSANTWTKAQRGAFITLSYSATTTIDMSVGNNFRILLTGPVTFNFTNLVAGQSGVINVWQDSTGGKSVGWQWMCAFAGGTAPTPSSGKYQMDQFTYMVNRFQTSTVTMTIATPCVVTWTAHGLFSGQEIQFTTTGALPTGLAVDTSYWINVIDANTFNLYSTFANLQNNTSVINTSGSQSGTHTAIAASITVSLSNAAVL